jgi:hypothetical protein
VYSPLKQKFPGGSLLKRALSVSRGSLPPALLLRRGIEVIGLDAGPLASGLLIPGVTPKVTARADKG